MSEAENAEDIEHDRQTVRAGVMSERYDKRWLLEEFKDLVDQGPLMLPAPRNESE
jgi:hypothetical protein